MSTVYQIEGGEWDSYRVEATFSTRDAAEESLRNLSEHPDEEGPLRVRGNLRVG